MTVIVHPPRPYLARPRIRPAPRRRLLRAGLALAADLGVFLVTFAATVVVGHLIGVGV